MNIKELRVKANKLLAGANELSLDDVAELIDEWETHQLELERQNDKLQQQLNHDHYMFAPIAYLILDIKGEIINANLVAGHLLGHDPPDLVGNMCKQYIASSSHEQLKQALLFASTTDSIQTINLQLLPSNNTSQQIDMMATMQAFHEDGQQCVRLVLTDVGEQLQANARFDESEKRFYPAMIDAPDPIMIHAEDGEILLVNDAWTAYSGYTHEDIPTISDWVRLAYGEDGGRVKTGIDQLYTVKGRKEEGDYRIHSKDGTIRIWNFSSSSLGALADGRRLEMSVARDMTDRHLAEKALAEREAFANGIIDTAPTIIASWNIRTFELKFVSKQIQAILGHTPFELLDKGDNIFDQLFHPDDTDSVRQHFQSFRQVDSNRQVVRSHQFRSKDKNGNWHSFIAYDTVIALGEDGKPSEIIGAAMDVTELIQAQERIQELNTTLEMRVEKRTQELQVVNEQLSQEIAQRRQLEEKIQSALENERELNNLKSQFVSMVSHEFRNPLAVILSSSELLLNYFDRLDDERRTSHLEKIVNHVIRLNNLLREVSFLNKNQIIGYTLQPVLTDLAAYIQDIADDIVSSHQNNVQVELEDRTGHAVSPFDHNLLNKIFSNLISNAVKYSNANDTVHISVEFGNSQATVIIEDHGIGIPSQDQKYLFTEPFHRGRNVGNIGGTGFGHTIIKQAVDAHGGDIQFVSEEGVGTTFTLILPLLK